MCWSSRIEHPQRKQSALKKIRKARGRYFLGASVFWESVGWSSCLVGGLSKRSTRYVRVICWVQGVGVLV